MESTGTARQRTGKRNDDVPHDATKRTLRKERTTMNPQNLQVQPDYRRQEMARSRGHRNWARFFTR